MNNEKIFSFLFCLTLLTISITGSVIHKRSDSEEATGDLPLKETKCQENEGKDCDIDYSNSNETGPLDSHEAMNTREFKARNKRSADVEKRVFRNMLLGLVHKKSPEMKKKDQEIQTEAFQTDASELLLELMVRIAAHPQQWNEVHDLLSKIDNDIMISKKILDDFEEVEESLPTAPSTPQTTEEPTTAATESPENKTLGDVQKLIILLDHEEQRSRVRNDTKNNEVGIQWPNLDDNQIANSDENEKKKELNEKLTTENMYPWNKPQIKSNLSKEKEFTFHRVTGKPLHYRSNFDKTTVRNAYVAVSAIGPKNKDNILEDELRQLKPWNHQDNLNRMESLRKKWFLQSDRQ